MAQGPPLTRRQLESRWAGFVIRGGWTKADLWRSELETGAPVVVKDFRRKRWFVRMWGRVQIAREAKFLVLIGDLGVSPRLLGRVDGLALAMELLEGTPLHLEPPGPERRPQLAALRAALTQIQERGIVHNDLRGRENILLRRDGAIAVLDWAGAVQLPRDSLWGRLLFRAWKKVDDSAMLKWVEMLDPASLTDSERRFLRRFRRWRWWWPFNRKGVGWRRTTE